MPAHRDLTGSDLHEPKGAANAPAGTVYTANGSGSGSWQPIVIPDPPIPNVILESNTQLPVSAKGTMVVSDGTNWPTVGLGSVGQVLTVSASTTTGVAWETPSGGGGGNTPNVGVDITQVGHGLSTGSVIYFDGIDWLPAQSDSATTLGTHVVQVTDPDSFRAVMCGVIGGVSGLTPGDWYFVSGDVPGGITSTVPLYGFSNPVGQALSTTELMVLPYRAQEIV